MDRLSLRVAAGLAVGWSLLASSAVAQSQVEALKEIADAADRICGIVAANGGLTTLKGTADAKAALGVLTKRLADLGISGKVEFSEEDYKGLARPDLPAALQRTSDCKERVFQTLHASMMSGKGALGTMGDPRNSFRGDSVRVSGAQIRLVPDRFAPSWIYPAASFTVENFSGLGFDAVLVVGSTSIGPCRAGVSTGLPLGDISNPMFPPQWRYIPVGGKQNVTLTGSIDCVVEEPATNIAAGLGIKIGDKIFSIPIGVSQVPVNGRRN